MPVAGQFCARCGIHHVRWGPRIVTQARLVAASVTATDALAPAFDGLRGYRTLECLRCGEVDRREGLSA